MGENITTRGVELLALPTGTQLHLGDTAVVEVTGFRNPCSQLDTFRPGLMAAVLAHDEHGNLIRKSWRGGHLPRHGRRASWLSNSGGAPARAALKGTDLSRYTANDLAAVAATLNSRPRKTLGWRTPAETFDVFLRSTQINSGTVATIP
jgi:hypothetical protein